MTEKEKAQIPSGLGSESDLPAVIAYLELDHHDTTRFSAGDLQLIRGAVQGFMQRALDGENSDITQLFTHALIESLLRTATQPVTDTQAKRKADAMLRATGLVGRLPEKALNGRLSGTMLEYMHEVMVREAFSVLGVSQAQVIRECVDMHWTEPTAGNIDLIKQARWLLKGKTPAQIDQLIANENDPELHKMLVEQAEIRQFLIDGLRREVSRKRGK